MTPNKTPPPPTNIPDLLELIRLVYAYRMNQCGPVPNGVYWKDAEGQVLRLEILLQAVLPEDLNGPISVNDFGCGYGALFELMAGEPMMRGGRYVGYDISEEMVKAAQTYHTDERASFIVSPVATQIADYSFVSGTYNMFIGADHAMWTNYIKTSLDMLWAKTDKVMAFNMLDDKSDDKLSDLYYADKRTFIEHAMTLSPDVEVIDDYPLSEFTIVVKRA